MAARICVLGLTVISLTQTLFALDLEQQDLAYGLALHANVTKGRPVVETGEMRDRLQGVFAQLVVTGSKLGMRSGQQLYILRSREVNAFSTGGGRIYVTTGLYEAVHGEPGLLACAMGHELGHSSLQHGIKQYLRQREEQLQMSLIEQQAGVSARLANLEIAAYRTAVKLAEKKIQRMEEHEADLFGLMLAAESGYHPDFAILLAQRMAHETGEQSRFGAFFSGHPRWETRGARALQHYGEATQRFDMGWPSVADSPGGVPPVLILGGALAVKRARGGLSVETQVSFHNLQHTPVRVALAVAGGTSHDPLWQVAYGDDGTLPISITIPKSALKRNNVHQSLLLEVEQNGLVIWRGEPQPLR